MQGKKDIKTFTRRNVDITAITSSHDLKELIKESLHDDISSGNFDVGYMQGKGLMLSGSALGTTYQKSGQISGNKGAAQYCGCDGLVEVGSKCSKSGVKRKDASDDESEEELP